MATRNKHRAQNSSPSAASKSGSAAKSGDEQSSDQTSSKVQTPDRPKTRFWLIAVLLAVVIVGVGLLGRWSLGSYCKLLAKQRIARFEYTEAIGSLEFAESLQSDDAETHFLKARIYRKTGKFDEFEKSLAKARTLGLSESRFENEKLLLRGQSGNMSELLSKLEDLVGGVEQFDPPEVYEALVNGFLILGRFNEATTYIEYWEKDFPEDPRQKFYKATLLFRYGPIRKIEGAKQQAEELLREVTDQYPTYYRAVLSHGDVLLNLNRVEEAAVQFEKCRNHPDAGLVPLISLAKCYGDLGRQAEAKEILQDVLEQDPVNVDARAELGKLQFNDEEFEQALDNLQFSYDARSYDPDLTNMLARTLEVLGRSKEADQLFQRASDIREKLAKVQTLMAEVDLGAGIDKRVELSEIILEFGDIEKGMLYLRSVLDVDPKHPKANELLRMYRPRNTGSFPRPGQLQ